MEKKSNIAKFVLIGLGVVGLGVVAYQFLGKPKKFYGEFEEEEPETPTSSGAVANSSTQAPRTSSGAVSSSFPLKQWSRGALVSALQSALNTHYGKNLIVDGVLGPNTLSAILSAGFPSVLYESDYKKIISGNKTEESAKNETKESSTPKSSSINTTRANKIAGYLRWHIGRREYDKVSNLLSILKTVNDYSNVNAFFKTKGINGGVRRTLVTALFFYFKDSYVQQQIRKHLYRIGLKKRDGKWHLSGVQSLFNQIKTRTASSVWNAKKQTIKVPKDTILGEFIGAQNGITKFRTLDGKLLYTNTLNVQYV